jgi:hypothetical protein
MSEMYKSTVKAVNTYMYPKQYVTLNASTVEEKETPVVVSEEPAAAEAPTPASVVEVDAAEVLEEINPKEMKKSELIEYIQMTHGEEADVSGTKAEIIERYFS